MLDFCKLTILYLYLTDDVIYLNKILRYVKTNVKNKIKLTFDWCMYFNFVLMQSTLAYHVIENINL